MDWTLRKAGLGGRRRRGGWRGLLGSTRECRALARLDDHLLRDIGITRQEADREAMRPVWDVPDHWRR
jgi:uncharacterized protein YjiS (DUF1127 family)